VKETWLKSLLGLFWGFFTLAWPCSTGWRKAGVRLSPHTPSWPRRCWCHLHATRRRRKVTPERAGVASAAIKTWLFLFRVPPKPPPGRRRPSAARTAAGPRPYDVPEVTPVRTTGFSAAPAPLRSPATGPRRNAQPHVSPPPQRVNRWRGASGVRGF